MNKVRRVVVAGMSGAGKSTFARALGEVWGLPVVHLDALFHLPGWQPRPNAEVQRDFDALAARESWIADGNYFPFTQALRERADVVFFFDFPRLYCVLQILRRWLEHRLGWKARTDLPDGFHEHFSVELLRWVWGWRAQSLPRWQAWMAGLPKERVVVFSCRRDVVRWLRQASLARREGARLKGQD